MLLPFLMILALFKGISRIFHVPAFAVVAIVLFAGVLLFGRTTPPAKAHHMIYPVTYAHR